MTIGERRVIAALGLSSIVFNTAAFALFVADVPPLRSSGLLSTEDWIVQHRGEVLFGSILFALAWTASVGFLTGLRAQLREAGPIVDIGWAAVLLIFAVVAVGGIAMQAVALLASRGNGPDVSFGPAILFASFAVSAAPTLLFAGTYATAIFRTGALPRWAGSSLLVVGVVHVGALVAVASSGVFSPQGAFAIAAPALYEIWQALVAIELLRRTD